MKLGWKQKIKYFFWTVLSVGVGIFLAHFTLSGSVYQKISVSGKEPSISQLQASTINALNPSDSQYFYFLKDRKKTPNVKAESFVVGDLDTGEIIIQKEKDTKFPIASVSKLMTAVVSTEIQPSDKTVIISKRSVATEGQNGELQVNEKIKNGDLIYPMLLESSNDAAEAIAEVSGRDIFIEKMNETSKSLGLFSTSFADPSGLSEKNMSTSLDLFKFSKYLKENKPNLLKLTTARSYSTKNHVWFNTSQYLGMDGYIGGKRGYINESLQTSLSAFAIPLGETGTRNISISILRSPDRLKDTQSILSFLKKYVYYGKESDADSNWVKQKEGIVQEIEPNFVNLLFAGDIMLDRGVKNSVRKNFKGDYSALFTNLSLLKKSDIAFANLEGPASDQGKDLHNLYSFRMDPSVIPALKGGGLSVVSVANNHAGDWGRDAYINTLSRLEENEILYTGGGMNKLEAEKPAIVEKHGMKIGYLGFTDVGPNWMEAGETKGGVLLASNPRFEEIVNNASKSVDYLIVSFHFGDEYKTVHNKRQEYLAHKAIDAGAKIVIGHHPHVAEDTEVYKNGFIAYSLGNFIFDQAFSQNTMQGMILEIKLWKDGSIVIKKNTVQLNKVFQPEKVIFGKEEKIKFNQ